MKFAFIDAERATWPVRILCFVLGASCSGFYAWKRRPLSPRAVEDAKLVVDIRAAHTLGRGAYGSPRVHRELRRQGKRVGKKRVERLMQREGIHAKRRKKFCVTTDSRHEDPIADNVVDRNFDVARPNEVWVTDVTYVPTREGWLYLAIILDLCSRRVVGWATSGTNDTTLALQALARATTARKPPDGWVHHSDRGSVYASASYRGALDAARAIRSMSGKGDCWDNAVAESFFSTIKGEMIDQRDFATRPEATAAIADYIDAFYNVIRLHSTIGYVSPIEFELRLNVGRETA